MEIIIYCLKDAATDWLLWGGIVFILLACAIRRLRWETSVRTVRKALTPHVIICAVLVTLFSILTGLFQSGLCMFICDILDVMDVIYILFVSYLLVTERKLVQNPPL